MQVAAAALQLDVARNQRADEAVRRIMQRLLATMAANEAGVRAGTDVECLHDFRIAVRRTRTLLSQTRGVIPQRERQRLSRSFNWLGDITGVARDADVYLLNFEAANNSKLVNALEPFHSYLQQQQQLTHKLLSKSLQSVRYAQLMTAWRGYLAVPVPVHSRLLHAQDAACDFANWRIWHILRRVIRQGSVIDADSPPQALHELRKSCKKLRYLIEFFQSFYPAAKVGKAIKVLKSLQDMLGKYQDLQVQQRMLAHFQQTTVITPVTQPTLTAVDGMMRKLAKRQFKVRKQFQRRFAGFMATRHQQRFKRLFKPR